MRTYPLLKPVLRLNAPQHGHDDYSTYVCSYFVRNAYRHLWSAYQANDLDLPGVTELAEWLYALAAARGARDWVAAEELEKMAHDAAQVALEGYEPRYRERAAKGGRHSRRRPTFTFDQLDAVAHLSIAAQAKELGCSTATISRLRKRSRIMADPDLRLIDQLDRQARTVGKLAPVQDLDELMVEAGIGVDSETETADTASEPVSVRITAVPIDIKTRKPISALQAAIDEFAAEEAAGPYAHMDEYAEVVGL